MGVIKGDITSLDYSSYNASTGAIRDIYIYICI